MDLRQLPVVVRRRVPTAILPDNYKAACTALAECVRVDEAAEWSNKMAALATYARQAKDDSLRVMAEKIQVRAERRVGELLEELFAETPSSSDRAEKTGFSVNRVSAAVRLAARSVGAVEAAMDKISERGITPVRTIKTIERMEQDKYEKNTPFTPEDEALREMSRNKKSLACVGWLLHKSTLGFSGEQIPDISGSGKNVAPEYVTWNTAVLGCTKRAQASSVVEQLDELTRYIKDLREKFRKRADILSKL